MKRPDCCGVILAFAVTAFWDVVLRLFAEEKIKLLGIENISWVKTLKPYFAEHTLLAAALIAGFVGGIAYWLIYFFDHPSFKNRFVFSIYVFIVSALLGFPMRVSGLFPKLEKYYYKPLPVTTIFSDGFSGIVVAGTIFFIRMAQEKLGIK